MKQKDRLRPFLGKEFLGVLSEAAKTYGWNGNYTEVVNFVKWCFELAGKELPDLTPYEDKD